MLQSTDIEALEGRILGDSYRIGARLGAGGMGAVFEATHLRTGRSYAIKVLLPEVAVRRDALERFRREAEAVGALGHANVVAIHDFVAERELAYLVMDRLEGEDLAARLKRLGRLSLGETLAILDGMAAGLEAAHGRGIVHRDLKPANVFLARQPGAPERPVLLDFGLARSFATDGDLQSLTMSGVVMGTPQYMSPEQASGLPLDARADLYSLATIVYEMLAGRPPFEAPTLPALFAKLATDPPTPIEVHRGDLPPGVSNVLTRALAKAAGDRYPDATSLANAMRAAAGGGVPHTSAQPAATPAPGRTASRTPVGNAAHSWPRELPPTGATPGAVDAHAPTVATPSGTQAQGAVATPASTRAHETTARTGGRRDGSIAALLLAGVLALGLFAVAGAGVAYWVYARETASRAPTEPAFASSQPTAPDEVVEGEPIEPQSIEPQSIEPQPIEPETVEHEHGEVEVAEAAPEEDAIEPAPDPGEAAEPPRSRRAPPRDRTPRREARAPGPEARPAAPGAPAAPSGPPPADGAAAAIAYSERGDYQGCIRETYRHPRSIRILSTRMGCATGAQDRQELRRTCEEFEQHFPQSTYATSTCPAMRRAGMF